jgi:hypothetical protein
VLVDWKPSSGGYLKARNKNLRLALWQDDRLPPCGLCSG